MRHLLIVSLCVVALCAAACDTDHDTHDTSSDDAHNHATHDPDAVANDDAADGTFIPPTTTAVAPITHDALFVVNGGSETLTVIDTTTHTRVADIPVYYAHFPHHLYLSRDGHSLWLAIPSIDLSAGHSGHGGHHGDGSAPTPMVMQLDATTGATLAYKILTAPNHNAIEAPDATIWTSSSTDPGTVLVLTPGTLVVEATITVGLGPSEVTFTADDKHALVANTADGTVSVIDVATRQVTKTLVVGQTPVGAWPAKNHRAFVDNETDKTLSVIDTQTLEVIRTDQLGFTPAMAALAPNGELWVTDTDAGRVVRLNADTGEVLGAITTGLGAHALAFRGDGAFAYVSNQAEDSLSVIDVAALSVVKTLIVGQQPNGLLWRPAIP